MELRLNKILLLVCTVLYYSLIQYQVPELQLYYGFSLGLIFFNRAKIGESIIYILIATVWLIFGYKNSEILVPYTLLIVNLYIYKLHNNPSLKNYLHLLVVLGYFLTMLPNALISSELSAVVVNLISVYSIFKIDEFKETPLSFLYIALSLYSLVLNSSLVFVLLFFLLVFVLNRSIVSFLRLLILLVFVYVKMEFGLDILTTTLIVSLFSFAILTLSFNNDFYLTPMLLSLFFVQKYLTMEYVLMFVIVLMFCEVFKSKREFTPC